MRVFVTGATGFIGTAVVSELLAAGHKVLGLARNDAAVDALTRAGVEAHRGDLADVEGLAAGARACDGVIHLAFIHDFSAFASAAETDRRAIEALVGALEGSGKPFIGTSGTAMIAPGRAAAAGTEEDEPTVGGAFAPRAASEKTALDAAGRGVRASIVRLSLTVHGAGDHALVPMLIDIARRTGVSAFVGDGANRWPAVHRLDAARLFRLAVEHAAPGACLHGVAEEGVTMRAIAEVIGEGLGVPVRSITKEEAPAHFGWMAGIVAVDNPISSAITQRSLGWHPEGPTLLPDMRENYFAS